MQKIIFVLRYKCMYKKHLSVFVLMLTLFARSQEKRYDKLLLESTRTVYSYPDEAFKVSDNFSKNFNDPVEKGYALYLMALSFYVHGQYDSVLSKSFESREIALNENDEILLYKNNILISEIISILGLKYEHFLDNYTKNIEYKNNVDYQQLIVEKNVHKIVRKGLLLRKRLLNISSFDENLLLIKTDLLLAQTLVKTRPDNALIYLKEAQHFTKGSDNIWEAQTLAILGEYFFIIKQNEKAKHILSSAQTIAEKLKNPFLLLKIHQISASNSLVLNEKNAYQYHNSKVLNLNTIVSQQGNNAANTAYQLISKTATNWKQQQSHNYSLILLTVGSILFILIIIKLSLYYYNKNKLKTYIQFIAFLDTEKKILNEKQNSVSEERNSNILRESEKVILAKLEKFELSKKFINKDMSLSMLASQLNTNTKYLSEIINFHKNKNFNAYVNELRISYITDKIRQDSRYQNYKISYLAAECGFSSHSTFTTVFKQIVGLSPIQFIEFVKQQPNS